MDSSQKNVLAIAGMLGVGVGGVVLNILFKAASNNGLSYFVFVFYSYLINTFLLLPVPFFIFRRNMIPIFKFPLLSRLCAATSIGLLAQLMGYKGIKYSTPTMASVMSNLMPAWTFMFAVLFRMEKLALRSSITQSKFFGTILSVIGAFIAVFYSGPAILSTKSTVLLSNAHHTMVPPKSNWAIGGTLLAAQHILYALIFIIQTQMMKICPSALLLTFLSYLSVTILSAPICFIAEKDLNAWRLKPDITLVALAYSGIFGGATIGIIHMWCLHIKGPVYVATFQPLSIAIAAIMAFFILGDSLHLGSVIGGVVIAVGVYGVIWGQAKEEKLRDKSSHSNSNSDSSSPLLGSHKVEENLPLNLEIHDHTNHQTIV
ncbi:nodulin MtN21 /EamA-like transporter family protein [Euphorbia peplus]|nr:nodulin MtN21 /EamA-like transporter family protein [Euphorbia peplus]